MMKKILFIVGSLRRNSFNLRLAQEAEKLLEGRAEVTYLDYADMPLMNQDIEFPEPQPVARIRRDVAQTDGIWIFTPEYNYSYPGHLKNLIDWLSRPTKQGDFASPTPIAGKKVCLSGAGGKAATANCREKLSDLLLFVRADLMKEPQTGVALGTESFINDTFELTAEQKKELEMQADAFVAFLQQA